MSNTTFVDKTTVIEADWLQDVNNFVYRGISRNVLDFGADPTGANDSTVAIQSAVDSVYAAGGGEVWMPPGTYKISASIYLKRHTMLVGPRFLLPTASLYGIVYDLEATIIGVAKIVPTVALTTAAVIWDFRLADELERPYGSSVHYIMLDLTACTGNVDGMYCVAPPPGEGVFGTGWAGAAAWAFGCVVTRSPRYGIHILSTSTEKVNLKIENCRVAFSGSHGIYVVRCFDVYIKDSFSCVNTGDGIHMSGCATERVHHNDVFLNQGNGIVLDGFEAAYSYNIVDNNGKHGLYIKKDVTSIVGKNYRITGGMVFANGSSEDNTYSNIRIDDESSRIVISETVLGNQAQAGANRVQHQISTETLPTQSPNILTNCFVQSIDLKTGNSIFDTNTWQSFVFDSSLDPGGALLEQQFRPLTPWTGAFGNPNVLRGVTRFKTANTDSAVLYGFSAGGTRLEGREVWVLIDDANTGVDFSGTTLFGNGGVDLIAGASQGKLIHFVNIDGTNWAATIYG